MFDLLLLFTEGMRCMLEKSSKVFYLHALSKLSVVIAYVFVWATSGV